MALSKAGQQRQSIEKWRLWTIILLVAITAVLSYGVALLNQNIDEVKVVADRTNIVANQNDRFVDNFSNYMTCLVVNDQNLVEQVGEETYIEICKQLLYRGINPIPETIKPDLSILEPQVPATTTTTRATQTSTATTGGE